MPGFNSILMIEDNPGDFRLVREYLHERFGAGVELRHAGTLAEGLARLRSAPVDVVLLDLGLPDSEGLQTFHAVNDTAPTTPIVILSGSQDERAAALAVQVGAEDYLAKHHVDGLSLARAMRHAVQRRQLTETLRHSESRYRTIVETAEEGILLLDGVGHMAFANARLHQMLGVSPNDDAQAPASAGLLGRPLGEWLDAGQQEALQTLLATRPGERSSAELRLRRAGGGTLWVVAAAGCPRQELGDPEQRVVMLTDISGRKLAEGQLLELKAELEARVARRTAQLQALNAELESFNYTVAHDLRTPLNGILGFAALMRDDDASPLPAPQAQRLGGIERSARGMDALIGGLLDLARLQRQPLAFAELDLSALARSVSERLSAAAPERQLLWEIEPGLHARGDPTLIGNVLANLLHNAWKYSATKPVAVIHIGQMPAHRLPPGTPAVYFVRDNGVGFDMADAAQLFGSFQRLPSSQGFEGSGIGLATVRRIIERHGGRVWAESRPGQGASFYFTLVPAPAPMN